MKPERRTLDGIVFDSKLEMERYAVLKQMEDVGLITELCCQPSWKVEIAGVHYCTFTADFSYKNDRLEYVIEELKSSGSRKDASYKLRRRAAELTHDLTIIEIVR